MTNKKGFTLIELLIVVLIIGILSSVALPRYRNSIQKAKLAEADIAVSAAKRNIEIYLDANGWPQKEGEEIWFTGSNSVGSIELPGDCKSDVASCVTDYGGYIAICLGNSKGSYCKIGFVGNQEMIDIGFDLKMEDSNEDVWYVASIKSSALVCQWVKERGYPGSSDVVSKCSKVGVQLDSIDEGE